MGNFCFFRKSHQNQNCGPCRGTSWTPWRFSEHQHLFLFYKTNTCTCNIYNNTVSCLLLHVSAEPYHLQVVSTTIYGTQCSIIHYNSNTYYIAVISAAEVHNVRSREMLLKFHMLVYRCGFHYCIQSFLFLCCVSSCPV